MSWYIPENSKIVFSLSVSANRCIDNDRITFANSEKGVDDFSDFVIVLMQNFAPNSETAIGQRIAEKAREYAGIGLKRDAIEKLRDALDKELQAKARDRLQKRQALSVTRKFNCSAKIEKAFASDYINEESSREVYGNVPGRFIRALLEEYAELPFEQRERYYFYENWKELNKAVELGKCIELTTYSRINRRDKQSRNKLRQFKPSSLEVDPVTGYNYVVGVGRSLKTAKENPETKWEAEAYRLGRIVGLRDSLLGIDEKLTKDDLQKLAERRKENDISSMTSKAEEITVAFTKSGLKTLCQIGINRPRLKDEEELKNFSKELKADFLGEIKENKGKGEAENASADHKKQSDKKQSERKLVFICPANGIEQAQVYFRRFGIDAVILPDGLNGRPHKDMGDYYRTAEERYWEYYQNDVYELYQSAEEKRLKARESFLKQEERFKKIQDECDRDSEEYSAASAQRQQAANEYKEAFTASLEIAKDHLKLLNERYKEEKHSWEYYQNTVYELYKNVYEQRLEARERFLKEEERFKEIQGKCDKASKEYAAANAQHQQAAKEYSKAIKVSREILEPLVERYKPVSGQYEMVEKPYEEVCKESEQYKELIRDALKDINEKKSGKKQRKK